MQEAGEVTRQPSTSQQGAKIVTDQQEEEEDEEWESVDRPPFNR